ncbi:MAG: IS3 family transposase [Actinomycetota bacterium]|nr:IS3 family transposase [Actinomycetota bacterium]
MSESGFHAQRDRPLSQRAVRHAWLTDVIRQVHAEFRGVYGARRVHAELTLGHGIKVGHEAVALLMRRAQLQGVTGRPRYRRTPNFATAGDLVDRQFAREERDQLWVTDITEHPTREGKVYCAVVLDTFSRRDVGWAIDASQTASLVTNALGMAIEQRAPSSGTVIHSDQGTQFTSIRYGERLAELGAVPSIGTVGDSYDNALAETVNGLYKTELIRGPGQGPWKAVADVELATLGWVHWHNTERLHGYLGDVPPVEFETTHYALLATTSERVGIQ